MLRVDLPIEPRHRTVVRYPTSILTGGAPVIKSRNALRTLAPTAAPRLGMNLNQSIDGGPRQTAAVSSESISLAASEILA